MFKCQTIDVYILNNGYHSLNDSKKLPNRGSIKCLLCFGHSHISSSLAFADCSNYFYGFQFL